MMIRAVIIDDEAWTRDTIKRLGRWREAGISVVGEASDGTSGLEAIRQTGAQLVITDMQMPGMDGVGLLKALEDQGTDARIIVVSGHDDYSYTHAALRSRVYDYLLKPLDPREFNKALFGCVQELRELFPSGEVVPDDAPGAGGAIESSWLYRYREIRGQLKAGLETLSSGGVASAFSRLEELCGQAEQRALMAALVKVNRDLLALVEEQAILWKFDTAFPLARISYPLASSVKSGPLLTHYRSLLEELVELKVGEAQRKQRLDVEPIRRYIDIHYRDGLSLEQLSRDFSVSKEYLSATFKREIGTTFSDYVLGLRMEEARQLIADGRIPLQKVAEGVGYIDMPHFYKSFKRYFGCTPGEMRNRLISDNSSH